MGIATLEPMPDVEKLKLNRRSSRHLRLFEPGLVKQAILRSIVMLDPRIQARNPVMFLVEGGALLTLMVVIESIATGADLGLILYQIALAFLLVLTVLFANFAEALAEARGKAQAKSLRDTRRLTTASRLGDDGEIELVPSNELKSGDRVIVEAGAIIPADGEIIEGAASVDESAVTGESAPVIREAGGDRSGVTGGTRVLSDRIIIEITAEPGASFLDRMIALVEGARRQKTPNEIALAIILAAFSIVFLIVTASLYPMARFFDVTLDVPTLVALLVCLIPTTIGGLLAAIGIAGMDRALQANLVAKSGKAVEVAGDVDTLLLDKTGTITLGNRRATRFTPMPGVDEHELARLAALASLADLTPEGKSVLELARRDFAVDSNAPDGSQFIEFSAQTRSSGVNLPGGLSIRKGAPDTLAKAALAAGHEIPENYQPIVDAIARDGSTPLAVSRDGQIVGVVTLEDILKPGIQERFLRLKRMGLRVVMVTGDNPLTARSIADRAGVDDFIAQATPEAKLAYIRSEQAGGKLVAMMGDGTNDAPALAQADLGVAMNSGTQAAKEASNMVDLDSDPTKLIEVVEIGKQLLMTRGALTTFSIANDLAKYFAVIPAMFVEFAPLSSLRALDVMGLASRGGHQSAILSAVIFNAVIIPLLIPIAIKGVAYRPVGASALLRRNLLFYGLGGVVAPFLGIKLIDWIVDPILSVLGLA